jgi:hypothetical protein
LNFNQFASPPSAPPAAPSPGNLPPSRKVIRRRVLLALMVMLLIAGGTYAGITFTAKPVTPVTVLPSPQPGLTAAERTALGDKITAGNTILQVTRIIADDGQLGTLLAKALQVTGEVSLGSNLVVKGNGTFGANLSAANISGNGAGLTNVNATLLNGQPSSFYSAVANLQGTLSDSQLSANVALRNAPNTFSSPANFDAGLTASGISTGTLNVSGSTSLGGTTTISSLILSAPLSVSNGGTGLTTIPASGVVYGQDAASVGVAVPSGAGQCLVSTATDVQFGSCSGAAAGVSSLNGLIGALTLGNATASGTTLTINSATAAAKGIASFNATNFSVVAGAVNTAQNISVGSTPSFAGLNLSAALTVANGGTGATSATAARINLGAAASGANADIISLTGLTQINPGSALTVGNAAQVLTLQGTDTSTLVVTAAGKTTTVGFASPTANVTYAFQAAAAGAYGICTTAGNCTGTGGGVTTPGGTAGTLAKFTAAQGIANSIITDDGTTVAIGGILAVNTITPTAALQIGTASQNVTLQGAAVALKANAAGFTNTLTFAAPAGASKSITLPNATGTVAVSASGPIGLDANGNLTCPTCLTSGGGGGTAGVSSLDAITGDALIQGTANQLIVTNNTGTKTVTLALPQSIAAVSSPTFASLTLNNALAVTNAVSAASLSVTGAITGSTFNALTLTAAPTGFSIAGGTTSKTLTVATNVTLNQDLQTSSAVTFGSLTLGSNLTVANGGTGAATAAAARTNLGAATSGANGDITSLSGLSTALSVAQGGTGLGAAATNGQLLIGNGAGYTLSTLTAGAGIQITNAAGSITVTAPNAGSCTTCATTALSNLSAVSLNTSLLPGAAGTIDLGSGPKAFGQLYLAGTSATPATNNFLLTGVSTGGTRTITLPDNSGTLAVAATGNIALNTATGTISFTGLLPLASGGTNSATAAGARTNLGAAAAGANADITSIAGLTTALTVAQGGTGTASLAANGIIMGNGTGALSSVTAAGIGQCLLSTAGAPIFQACPAGGVSSLNAATGALTITGVTGTSISTAGSTITINDATTAIKGLASFDGTNLMITNGAVTTAQGITTASAPTFAGLTANGVTTVATNSATTFQVQNASAAPIIAVNTLTNQLNVYGGLNLVSVAAPTTALIGTPGAAGPLNDYYYYTVTYVTASGETDPGPKSGYARPINQQVNLTAIPVSPNSLVTARKIYRSPYYFGDYQLVATINNNTATTYTDSVTSPGATFSKSNSTASLMMGGITVLNAHNNVQNTFVGIYSGISNTSGEQNTSTGFYALHDNTLGSNLTGIGTQALRSNTTGVSNTGVGMGSLLTNTAGSFNTASGTYALQLNAIGNNNTATGMNALYNLSSFAGDISATVNSAGNAQFTTSSTTGLAAGMSIVITGNNYYGSKTVMSVDSGTTFTIAAAYSSPDNVGSWATPASDNNTAVGSNSGNSATTYAAAGNSLFGANTGLLLQTGANNNSLIGVNAGSNLTTGSNNILIGQNVAAANAAGNNQLNIGNTIFGDTSTGSVYTRSSSATAFQVQNSSGVAVLNANTATAVITLGTAASLAGKLTFANATNASGVTIAAGTTTAGYSLTLPTAVGASGDCLKDSTGTGVLAFGSCTGSSTGVTLQATSPGSPQTGNFNLTGTGIAGILQAPTVNTASLANVAATGSNTTGTNLTVQSGNGTGSGGSGDIIFSTAPPTGTAPGVGTTTSASDPNANILTFSHTVAAGSGRVLIIEMATSSAGSDVSSATYAGQALTLLSRSPSGFNTNQVEMWYLLSPPTGSNTVVVNYASYRAVQATAINVTGADLGAPFGTPVATSGASTTESATVTSLATDTILDVVSTNNGAPIIDPAQTPLWSGLSGVYGAGSRRTGTNGSLTMSWTTGATNNYVMIAVPIHTLVVGATPDVITERIRVMANGNVGIGTATPQATLDLYGKAIFKPVTDAADIVKIQNAAGTTNILSIDSTNLKVTVTNLTVTATLTVNGHIVTGGTAPTIAAGTAACTTPTISIVGTDTAGLITVTTGTGCTVGGKLGTVSFATAFGAAPRVSLTSATANAPSLQAFIDSGTISTSAFDLGTGQVSGTPVVAVSSTTYKWYYSVLQ